MTIRWKLVWMMLVLLTFAAALVVPPPVRSTPVVASTALVPLPLVNPVEVEGSIIAAGSSTVFPLAERIASELNIAGSTSVITIDSIGSGAGFERFCVAAETDISNASRPIRADEIAICQDNGRDPIAFRLGTDAIAVAVSRDNDFVEDVTLAELATIFSTAETWQDVRPDWPAELIQRFAPSTDTDVFEFFIDEVFDQDPEPLLRSSNLQQSVRSDVLIQAIRSSPFSVGFFPYVFAAQEPERLNLVALDNVAPTTATVETDNYPLVRPLLMYSTAEIMQQKPQVAAFLNYALTEAPRLVSQEDYTPPTTTTLNQSRLTWLTAMGLLQRNERVYLPLVRTPSTR